LGVTLKTAWVMSHRAARQGALSALPPMGGAGETVEADETLIGRIEGEKKRPATPITRRASRKSESVIGCGGQKKQGFCCSYQRCTRLHSRSAPSPQGPDQALEVTGRDGPKPPRPISCDNLSSAATRFSVDGWVENRLSMPRPDNGLTIERGAVAGWGFRSVVWHGFRCARDFDERRSQCIGPTADTSAKIVGGIFACAADRHLHDHGSKRRQDEHEQRTNIF
jgi:hypothetical protein